ncbi:cytochrome d ubiquinol oxidase subunit II [Prevotella melaninogenica]|uniref:cytochrome d ubiquinol oxidase subunit II n=1 Tax=Prevotella melaninogenica TaxID=28132 RepID=UPI0001AEB022|nr:cytochrome d ubiquinol oxidase subunit II [Prevotella melaninogenica]ADK95514.1 putative cytochrome d ubiquinol oxidase, subunit II [Prevotella melaninogenica ATCC 25845]ASE17338.1 cytochrome d ubiquinol oxidase subunit II [Prevotella melaninogenica]MBW4734608.1 cytochrome d ubiquinol oxidase subunit II [Prevotella melaninogenica]MBW4737096.1 cytochrome d ubiquinol oxidase subunit II [Prevotella melaninogenica]MBW4879737.1 cytochrome d ubiquinol oxidase subunit II [Prevotella melaninogenica
MTYDFLQHYWWFIVSLLGALLVFLLFVQGANSMIFQLGKTEEERRMLINSTGRKWEFTFTTLVTFGGAFFASFPLFYSTSFGGAYWVWVLILFTFIIQAISYEFQNKAGNLFGVRTFQTGLIINGILGPLLLGGAVATFFTGSNFIVEKGNITDFMQPVISHWANGSRGLDVLLNPWVVIFGISVVFLARILGTLYINNNVNDDIIRGRVRKQLLVNTVLFLLFFLPFLIVTLVGEGYAVNEAGVIVMEPMKYLNNLLAMWPLAIILLVGVVLLLFGIVKTVLKPEYVRGIWPAGIGVVLVVLVLFLIAGWNNTAYYPSTAELQSSLTLQNSSSSEFTLKAMFYVSFLVPFVLAYIVYAWRAIDKKAIDRKEIAEDDHAY